MRLRGNNKDLALNFREVLYLLGCDLGDENLRDTPKRYSKFMADFVCPKAFKFTTFKNPGLDEMVIQDSIPWYSLCAHHTLPMFGQATVAYIPKKRIAGLSKLARCVQFHASGFRTQEQITKLVAEEIQKRLEPIGVAIVLKGIHLCMVMRGVRAMGAETTTSCLLGAFRTDTATRMEFLSRLNKG